MDVGRREVLVGAGSAMSLAAAAAYTSWRGMSGEQALGTIANVAELAAMSVAILVGAVVAIERVRRGVLDASRLVLTIASSLLALTTVVVAYFGLCQLVAGFWLCAAILGLAWRIRERRATEQAVARVEARAQRVPDLRGRAAAPVAGTVEERVGDALRLARSTFTLDMYGSDAIALLAVIDVEARVCRVRAVVGGTYDFRLAVLRAQLPFVDIKYVADQYNKFVEFSASAEGRGVSGDELVRRFRSSLAGRASAAAYAILLNSAFLFPDAFNRCLVCRFEFLEGLAEPDQRRYQIGDMAFIPVRTAGEERTLGVVLVGSLSGRRLVFNKDAVRAVAAHWSRLVQVIADSPDAAGDAIATAYHGAVPARKSPAFKRLMNLMTPSFSKALSSTDIGNAVHEHGTLQGGWSLPHGVQRSSAESVK